MFKNLLIADSGKGHVEEMIRMLQDIPSFREAQVNLLHVVPEQNTAQAAGHRSDGQSLLNGAVERMGLPSANVNALMREGDTTQQRPDRDGISRPRPPSINPCQQRESIRLSAIHPTHAFSS